MADALKFNKINEELQQKITDDRENHWVNPYAFKDENAVRRDNSVDKLICGVLFLFVIQKK